MNVTSRTWRIAAVSAVVLAAAAAYLSIATIDITPYRARLESMIEETTGRRVGIEAIAVRVLPHPDFNIRRVSIYQGDSTLFHAPAMRLKLRLLPLLSGGIVVEDLSMAGALLSVERDKDGSINLVEFLRETRIRPRIKALAVEDSVIRISDAAAGEAAAVEFTGVNVSASGTDRGVAYEMSGALKHGGGLRVSGEKAPGGGLSGRLELDGFDLALLTPYARAHVRGAGDAALDGSLAIRLAYGWDGVAADADGDVAVKDASLSHPGAFRRPVRVPSGSARITLRRSEGGVDAALDALQLAIEDFDLKGYLRAAAPAGRGRASFDLSVALSADRVPLKTLFGLIPSRGLSRAAYRVLGDITPHKGVVVVEKAAYEGTVDVSDGLRATGRARGAVASKGAGAGLSLSARLEGLAFGYRGLKGGVSGLKGRVLLKDGDLTVDGVSARHGSGAIEDLSARLKDIAGKASYEVSLKGSLDAGDALRLARTHPGSAGPALSRGLARARASGRMGLSLRVDGSLKGRGAPSYSGASEVVDIECSYDGIPFSFRSLSGSVGFDNRGITLKGFTGNDGYSDISFNGRIDDHAGPDPFIDIEARGEVDGRTIKPALLDTALEGLAVDGRARFNGKAKGRLGSLSLEALVDAGGARVGFGGLVDKAPGQPVSVAMSARIEGEGLAVQRAAAAFGGSSIEAEGNVSWAWPEYRVTLSSERLDLADLASVSPYLAKDFESTGLVRFRVSAARARSDAMPSYEGTASVNGARFSTTLLASPVERVDATGHFNGNRAFVTLEGLKAGSTVLTGSLDVLDISGRVVKFDLHSPRLSAADIFNVHDGREEAPSSADRGARLPALGSGTLNVAEGDIWGHEFRDLSASIELNEKDIRIKPFSIEIDRGRVTGTAALYLDATYPRTFETSLRVSGVDIESMITGFGAKKSVLTGTLDGTVALSGRRGASPATAGLDGEARLDARNGRLWKFYVLNRIFSIVNIFSIDELFREGVLYRDLSGGFSVKNGVVGTDDMVFDSDSMRMSAVGEVDLPGLRIDGVLALHPFVTIDKIISSIPLAGWIITGEEKSMVSMYYLVEGPLNDPVTSPAPVKTIEEGVLGILERLLSAPVEALSPP
jgi:uncharacterized protein YhdP